MSLEYENHLLERIKAQDAYILTLKSELKRVKEVLTASQQRNTDLSYRAYPARNASGE